MAMKTTFLDQQVRLVCNENLPELTNAKNFLYNNLKNKGYCETLGITEHTPLSRMVNLLNSFIPYAEPHLYIYNQGFLNTTAVGGEAFKTLTGGKLSSYYIHYEEDYIEALTNDLNKYDGYCCYLSHIKIPTSQYNTLKMEYQMIGTKSGNNYMSIKSENNYVDSTKDIKSVGLTPSYDYPAIVTMDISDINYDAYFAYRVHVAFTDNTIRIYRIWMEK